MEVQSLVCPHFAYYYQIHDLIVEPVTPYYHNIEHMWTSPYTINNTLQTLYFMYHPHLYFVSYNVLLFVYIDMSVT